MEQAKKDKLANFLRESEDWAKLEAGDGIYIVKMPGSGRFKTKLALEISPVKSDGKPFKKKGLFITNQDILNAFIDIFSNTEISDIFSGLEEVNEGFIHKDSSKSGKVVGKL